MHMGVCHPLKVNVQLLVVVHTTPGAQLVRTARELMACQSMCDLAQ